MRNPRIFTDQPLSEHHVVNLDAAAVRHVSQVLRLKQGQTVTLFNGEGGEFDACLQDVGRGKVSVETSKFRNVNCESPLKIDLGHGLVKGERMDFVVQKAVELGATTITPLIAERSMVKLSPERIGKRLSHWRGIAVLQAAHGTDIGFTFGTYARDADHAAMFGAGPAAAALAAAFQDALAAFARTGDPSTESLGAWPAYGDSRATMILGEHTRIVEAPYEQERKAWERYSNDVLSARGSQREDNG